MGQDEQGRDMAAHGAAEEVPTRPAGRLRAKWLAMAVGGLGVAASVLACHSSSNGPTVGGNMVPAYLIVTNYGSLPAILSLDLSPPVQLHAAINSCHSLALQVPVNDTVKMIITDSTATASATFEVPFFQAGVWGVDCGPGGNPVALGAIGQYPTTCTSNPG